jgi:tRNA G18 (ribose-2'-O)-methylase SpoU
MATRKTFPNEKLFVLVHNIRSLHNVGAIFRTSEFFGVSKVFLSGYTGTPNNSDVTKVALGTEKLIPWEYRKSPSLIIKKLLSTFPDLQIVALENNINSPKPQRIDSFKFKKHTLLVVGEEVAGIPKALLKQCNTAVEINRTGAKESLNVSVAFGVAVYAFNNFIYHKYK